MLKNWIGSSTGAIFDQSPSPWIEEFSGAPYSFNGLTLIDAGGDDFLAVGDGGLILRHK